MEFASQAQEDSSHLVKKPRAIGTARGDDLDGWFFYES